MGFLSSTESVIYSLRQKVHATQLATIHSHKLGNVSEKSHAIKGHRASTDDIEVAAWPAEERKRKHSGCDVTENQSILANESHEAVFVSSEPRQKKLKRLKLIAILLTRSGMKPVQKIQKSLRTYSGGKSDGSGEQSNVALHRADSVSRPDAGQPGTSLPGRRCQLTYSWSMSDLHHLHRKDLSPQEIKRQEAIIELYCGEQHMVHDLEMLKNTYRNSLLQLKIIKQHEADWIFGDLEQFLTLHTELQEKINSLRGDHSRLVPAIGHILLNWVPRLECYISYCHNRTRTKAVLEAKKENDKRFCDFLQRCLDSPFSRKLDLWSFLDVPRSRLMKYPLLIGEILNRTPKTHIDVKILPKVLATLASLLQKANQAAGEGECSLILEQLVMPSPGALHTATQVVCAGELKDCKGLKVQCFLFDKGFVMSRHKTGHQYLVSHEPIPACELEVEELNPLRTSPNSRLAFRVRSADSSADCNFVLIAKDEHTKKRWMDSIRQVMLTALRESNANIQRVVNPTSEGLCLGPAGSAYRLAQSASLAESDEHLDWQENG